jgi:hypothetical protein
VWGTAAALAVLFAATAGAALADEPAPGPAALVLPEVLPLEPDVKDPVFAVLVAVVRADLYGVLTRAHLERELQRRRLRSRLPYGSVRDVARVPAPPGARALVTVRFEGALAVPIPYSILWYHPGRIRAGDSCVFREWALGNVALPYEAKRGAPLATLELEDVHLFDLDAGRLEVDIDGWLDRLMGSALDDTDVSGLVVFRYAGRHYGMALGYNRGRRARSGAFDFLGDRIVFPASAEFKAIARQMRARLRALTTEASGLRSAPRAGGSPKATRLRSVARSLNSPSPYAGRGQGWGTPRTGVASKTTRR